MPAYVTFLIDIRDPAGFTGYARAAAPTYARYGGKVALRGPITEVAEGRLDVGQDTRLVVLEFSSLKQARAWWDSAEYRSAVKLRQPPVSDTRAFLVDGIDIGHQA
jgi:uncharacterized protein (DUF1330 family)